MMWSNNGIVVVAHPDDELLWAGGLIARYKYPVICCSIPRSDPIRAWKFFDVCATLGVTGRLLPFTEPPASEPFRHLDVLDLSGFDLIVTHNETGEYGHVQHVSLNRFVMERWKSKAATFGYGGGSVTLELTKSEQDLKLKALRCYDHVSPHDGGKPKWQALLDRYAIDLCTESFNPPG